MNTDSNKKRKLKNQKINDTDKNKWIDENEKKIENDSAVENSLLTQITLVCPTCKIKNVNIEHIQSCLKKSEEKRLNEFKVNLFVFFSTVETHNF